MGRIEPTSHLPLIDIPQQEIAITATFTSEPIEDSLSYWLKKIGFLGSIGFAPYNQVFQEILNPASILAQNQNGVNVILVRFEDWSGAKNRLQLVVDNESKTQVIGDRSVYNLPNHLEIAHLNQYETEYLYQEIFVDRVYSRHGIVFNENDCIVDVGANIGLFTLFAQQKSPKGSIYSFEPAPHAFDKLQTNAQLYCENTHLFNCGLGGENREETFTFYPRSSVFSSFAADTEEDEKAIRSVIVNMLQRDNSLDEESLEGIADDFLEDRLEKETYQAQIRTLSEIIEEYEIAKIDLLKLDAEKSELAILQGIKDHHWSLIKQIVMEVHDPEGSTLKQVMGLLEDKGFQFVVDEESMLHGSGLFNIYATRLNHKQGPETSQVGENASLIEQTVKDFANALKTARSRSQTPYLVCICPPSPTNEPGQDIVKERMEELLAAELQDLSGMYLIKSQELTSTYPVEDYYDPYGDELGHIPYTPTFFSALGTMVARKIFALKSSPYKVIVLDCDQTLWQGVCGEETVEGLKITPPYRKLQEFIIGQQAAGKLICLCSKNQEEDVWAVFDEHADMLLKREHLVDWRINWQEKSANLKSMATELQLGLDSFIFIDDNPVECAEVRANCPEVLTLQLPAESDRIPQFLSHIWAFDQLQTTKEDQARTNLYQQNIQRQRFQESSLSFSDFLAQLNLEIEISPIQTEQLARAAQLTQRTNQFNLTTIRRSESQIQQLCNSEKFECQVVKVKDRFGDYGLVGLLLFETQENALYVDTFLLSCRVLGRGVEHKMLAHLGAIAQEKGLKQVKLDYKPTQKNQPIINFLNSVGSQFQQKKDDGWQFNFPSQVASEINFIPILEEQKNLVDAKDIVDKNPKQQTKDKFNDTVKRVASSEFLEHIAQNLYSPELILQEIISRQQGQRPQLDIEFIAPRTPLEKAIADLFAEVLNLEQVGINDNFFELGGDSIRGAILINQLQGKLKEIIHFVVLFDTKTVKRLAIYLEENYSQAVAKLLGQEIKSGIIPQERINEAKVLQMRSLIPSLAPPREDDTSKNPPAIFILSPHRSGSTLLRVMLGGNPQLFAPPELELLKFNTLGERNLAFSGRYSFWGEGTIRTIMEIRGCSSEEAIAIMSELSAKNLTTKEFYSLIQEWLEDKILVDKTPSYSIDLETLQRAEINFQNPIYIHLMRHPYGTMRSYEEARVEQTFPYQHPFNKRELAELVWLISHQNILEFLEHVPQERQYQVKFEDIVSQPQTTVEGICQFLGVDFHPEMLQPYKEKKQRMTDGIYADSRMVGDVKFHQHQGINPSTADSWQDYYQTDFLGKLTWQVAESLGYFRDNGSITKIQRKNPAEPQTFPVSFAQQRLWFLAQLEPDSPFYNMFKAVRLNGRINIAVLERSLNEIIRRHEVLRTNFDVVEGKPVQVIAPQATIKPVVLDLQGLSGQEQSEQLQRLATQDQLQPFDLTQGLLLRVTLVQLKPDSFALLLTMHHIIGDGWSLGVLIKELSSLYQSFLLGEPVSLTELPIQYADFTVWQRRWLQGKALQTQINYWQQQLADAPPLLELPTDRSRPSVQTFRGQCFSFQLDAKLTASLKELSHKSGTTLFMTLMAAYATLMSRYSGQEDILIGTPIANRNQQDLEELIGFFVNSLVMRTRLEDNPSFSELLKQVRSTCLDAYGNQDVPFEQIVETLQIERSLSHSPLFQVMFALQNTPGGQLATAELEIAPLNLDNVNAKLDLTLQMWETNTDQGNFLEGFWQYNTDLFDQDRISRLTGHFQTLLARIVANPQEFVGKLPLLTERERHQLLGSWNNTDTAYPDTKCIHQLFEEQVERNPKAIAVVYEKESLTYQELNERANQLAHYLQSLGVTTEVLVGICVERSLEMIIGILAILKAGGAYVPLDPSYPPERLAYMLNDSQVSILLTQEHLLTKIPETNAQVISLDTDWEQVICQYSQETPVTEVSNHNLAYVIYTSGSTGQPKGVCCKHLGVVNLCGDFQTKKPLGVGDCCSLWTSLNFDVSVYEVFSSLLSGATLHIVPEAVRPDVVTLTDWLHSQQISSAYIPPFMLNNFSDCLDQALKRISLERLLVGVEPINEQLLASISQRIPGLQIINGYGPTETTICSTLHSIKPQSASNRNTPIGNPVQNTKIYLLDNQMQPVPVGVVGEIHIGGAGLAQGYLNRPELTQEKFISNPFSSQPNSRLYKTGDLARYLRDGNIEYLGRIDNQVKIRGFRIELGEIEAALSQHSEVQTACVIAREDTPGDKRLVAYIVPQPPAIPTSSELRQFLKAQLPDYMVPNALVMLESLPLTPNGKVDRRALPVPDLSAGLDQYVAPRTPTEEMLVQIWGQVLKVEQVGINNNFFELGGHSLLATQMVSRIRNIFQVELPLRELFASGTIAQLAPSIGQLQQQNQGLVIPPILPQSEGGKLSLSYAQQRLWFLDQLQPNSALYNIPIALRLEGRLNISALEQSLQTIIERHEALRTNFMTVDGEPTPIIHSETTWTISVVDLTHLSTGEQKTEAHQLAQQQANQPFDLARESLIRVTLVQLNQTEQWLLLCMHHIVSDGWSMGVLVEELAALYKAYSQGEPDPLMPLPIQYTDFAIWQREWLQADIRQRQLSYWQKQLADAPELLVLPTDRPRPAVQTFVGAHQEFRLSAELTSQLNQLSQQQGVTLFMTLLAAFDTLLYRYSGQSDILVGSPIANRNHSQIEGLIGFFVNTLVMRTSIEGNPSFSELLTQVREMAMDAYAHQDLPFEMLVEALQPERDLSYTPLFQVLFALQNQTLSQVDLTGLTASPLKVETGTSKFDLSLSMENRADGLVGVWRYSTDLFDASTIDRMTGNFVTLLEGIVANPQEKISQLPLLTEVEQRQLLVEWNNTEVDDPQSQSIHQLFEEQVQRTPNAVAVVFEEQQLTYRELNSRANQLAHYLLQNHQIEPDTLIGICLERSLEMIIGILGILKAGGAYVPLDPDYPPERLSFMLEDAQVSILLTQQQIVKSIPQHQAQVICLNRHWGTIAKSSESNPNHTATPDNLAYVIYTSGSTGKPKGVLVNHSNVVRLFAATEDWYNFNSQDVWTLFHSYAFDFSVWEIWGALLHGGRLVVVSYLTTRSPESFYRLLSQEKVTILNQTPSAFRQLIQAEHEIDQDLDQDLQLRLVIFGGEALEIKSLQPWFERHGDQCPQLVNMYGITETTVHVTYRPLSMADLQETASFIGRPIPDLQVYLLDSYLQPVPIGVPGEMHVGGAGVARGYLNRDALTAERFISSPLIKGGRGDHLYKTGDKARYLPNGDLEYLGRIDNQVKLRGFRIELGEIEALLASHPQVWETVVLVREDTPGDQRLVAYLVPQHNIKLKIDEIRQFMQSKLPDYMIPNAFVILEALPLTANGKVDRRALPQPDLDSERLDKYIAPRTPMEEKLVNIWEQVLKVEQVGINDNFFELGGHSLLVTQLVSRIRDSFTIELPLRDLFTAPTVSQLAQSIEQSQQENSKPTTIPAIIPRRKR